MGEEKPDPPREEASSASETREGGPGEMVKSGAGDAAVGGEERMWGMFAHLSALLGLATLRTGVSLPVLNIVGPLVIWLIKKDDMPFVKKEGREALNFQITMTLIALGVSLVPFMRGMLGLGVFAVDIVFVVIASMTANKGKSYRYPLNLRLIK